MEQNELTCVISHVLHHSLTTHFLTIDKTTILGGYRIYGVSVVVSELTESL